MTIDFIYVILIVAIGVMTMSNSGTRTINYNKRYTTMEEYDMLPKTLRDYFKQTITEWDLTPARRKWNAGRHSIPQLINLYENAEKSFLKKGFIPARGKRKPVISSALDPDCRVKPLKSTY